MNGMNQMLKAIVYDMEFNELQMALLGVIFWIQGGEELNLKDLEQIIDESKRR